jgi:hypothetical protein
MGTNGMYSSLIFEPKTYFINRSIELPTGYTTFVPNQYPKFVIDGNGCSFKKANNNQFDFFYRIPASQTVANNNYVQTSLNIKNFVADGQGGVWQGSGYSFLYLGASTGSSIENITLQNFDIGLRVEYCPGVVIKNIVTDGVKTNSVLLRNGSWGGASITNSGSNNAQITNVIIKDTISQSECVSVIASNQVNIEKTTIYGTSSPQYGIFVDSLTAANVVSVKIKDTNISVGASVAGIYLKVNDESGNVIDGLYNSVVQNVIGVEAYSGSPNVQVSNIAYWESAATLYNDGTTLWQFDNVNLGPGIIDSADVVDPLNNLWDTNPPATIPLVADVEYIPVGGNVIPTLESILNFDRTTTSGNIFMGTSSGSSNTGTNVQGIGLTAASQNTGTDVQALGFGAALLNTGDEVSAVGILAGAGQSGNTVVAFGKSAAFSNTGNDVIAIGELAASGNTGANVVAIGASAGAANPISAAVILSNTVLPSYLNFATASAAITGAGATTGTYLYHDQTTDAIGAVRIP